MGRDVVIYRSESSVAKLSTMHSESSFGRPVLLVDGQAYRPSDILPSGISAYEMVQLFLMGGKRDEGRWSPRTKRAVAMAEKFK